MDKREQQRSLTSDSTQNSAISSKKIKNTMTLKTDANLIERHGNQYAGRHYILDFWGMDNLDNLDYIDDALRNAALAAKATLLHVHLHEFSGGGGITGVALLAESHISIHTWPEYDYAAFDIFMCGQSEAEKAVKLLTSVFSPDKQDVNELLRGKVGKE